MAETPQRYDAFHTSSFQTSKKEIILPDGYELAHYTLRRVHDGYLQSYLPADASASPVHGIPIAAQISDVRVPRDLQSLESDPDFDLQLPIRSSLQGSSQSLHNIPVYEEHADMTRSQSKGQGVSEKSLKRYAHARDDDYTDVCGVSSPAKASPVKKFNYGKGEYCCARCGSNFTRPHHPSMAKKEAAIQRRRQATREASSMDTEMDDAQVNAYGQGIKFEEMDDALARASIVPAGDGPHIKTEFVFGAEYITLSIEDHFLERQRQSATPSYLRNQTDVRQTPDWRRGTSPRLDSSTPTPSSYRSETCVTQIPEWYLKPVGTPERTHGDGLQDDGLDGFMDRRSQISETPTPYVSLDRHSHSSRTPTPFPFSDSGSQFSGSPTPRLSPDRRSQLSGSPTPRPSPSRHSQFYRTPTPCPEYAESIYEEYEMEE
ncbi:MAG: hypothetical protein ASARMPREDX12_002138 [Alectoria sarmentosa]|nr:MAG: hypothetical protein ASARMPREDX12_002138 [Alectoria sarmentosa]